MHQRLKFLFYELFYAIVHLFLSLGFSLRTEGRNNIPRSGPVLIIANHSSGLDPILVGLSTRRHLTYLARVTLFRNAFVRTIFDICGAAPIDLDGLGKAGLQSILAALKQGRAVVVFPEGTRTEDGAMSQFRPGIQLLIKRARPAIVPIGIAGAFEAWPYWRSYPFLSPLFLPASKYSIAVCCGPPLDGERYASMSKEESLSDLFGKIQAQKQRAEKLRRKF